jgi:hypothetical protein
VSWHQEFFGPFALPSGRKLVTLRDAAVYFSKLPKAEWQATMQAQLLVAEHDGPTMFARIGMIKGVEPPHRTAVQS